MTLSLQYCARSDIELFIISSMSVCQSSHVVRSGGGRNACHREPPGFRVERGCESRFDDADHRHALSLDGFPLYECWVSNDSAFTWCRGRRMQIFFFHAGCVDQQVPIYGRITPVLFVSMLLFSVCIWFACSNPFGNHNWRLRPAATMPQIRPCLMTRAQLTGILRITKAFRRIRGRRAFSVT